MQKVDIRELGELSRVHLFLAGGGAPQSYIMDEDAACRLEDYVQSDVDMPTFYAKVYSIEGATARLTVARRMVGVMVLEPFDATTEIAELEKARSDADRQVQMARVAPGVMSQLTARR